MIKDKTKNLVSNPFTYIVAKNKKIMIFRGKKLVKVIPRKAGANFLTLVKTADESSIQLALAKLTGHYKHGNERKGIKQ